MIEPCEVGVEAMDSSDDLPVDRLRKTAREELAWSYDEAFSRHRGIISADEQERLRTCRVAIAGMGGIGGIDLVTLARLGVGRFTIADPDTYEVANTNRQFGATSSTVGYQKAQVMARIVRDINPTADVRVFPEHVSKDNVEQFLQDADLLVDAIDFFAIDARRALFRQAASQEIYAITAGPVGFSGIWIVFDPRGMSFDRYFDIDDDMKYVEKIASFLAGVAPKATQRSYMDLNAVDAEAKVGPSSSIACHIAAGGMACEAIKILLGKGRVNAAPHYHQFDPFVGQFENGRLWGGNRHPFQRLKRRHLVKFLKDRNIG